MIILSTTSSEKSAQVLAEKLLEQRSATCVNLINGCKSFYVWQGQKAYSNETMLIIKGKYKKVKDILLKYHTYELPEIIALKPKKIEKNYKKWLKHNLKGKNMFIGTRSKDDLVTLSHALLNPSASHGGLYVSQKLPTLDKEFFKWAKDKSYTKIALKIIEKFDFDIPMDTFKKALKRYEKFDKEPVEIKKLDENLYINELWHGPTRAFKDMALQPFGAILKSLAKQNGKKYLIMCATSGDTGPATLQSFSEAKNIQVVCLYPKDGTSEVQRLQMVNADGSNLKVIGINGNFDDAQRALKTLLNDDDFKDELTKLDLNLSAANSVNFGRILFQIIYHIYVCIYITKNKKPIDIIVPSGNFGNALGAYYAKKMGANIAKIKIASNSNNILTELFTNGIYDLRNRTLIQTISPAMDILISSNVERLLFDKFGYKRTKELMDSLASQKFYELDKEELALLQEDFEADFCTDQECEKFIKKVAKKGKLIDPHTATCFKQVSKNRINVITSTAQWVKFTPSMIKAIKNKESKNELKDMKSLSNEFKSEIPSSILKLFDKKEIHKDIVNTGEIKETILGWLKK